MRAILRILIIELLFNSCCMIKNPQIVGHYKSSCYNLGFPELEVSFYENKTFQYKYAHNSDLIMGRWEIRKDTLFLYSEIFKKEIIDIGSLVDGITTNPNLQNNSITFNGQYTQEKSKDIYLIKCKYLFKMTKNGFTKKCRLIKIKNH